MFGEIMAKILHIGDIHIGVTNCDSDIREAMTYVAAKARDEIKPDRIVIPGDIYDGVTTPDNRNMARDIVLELAEIAPVVIIRGNHDIPNDLSILGSLAGQHQILVFERPGVITCGDIAMHFLPHFTKSLWIAARMQNGSIEDIGTTVSQFAINYLRAKISEFPEGTKHLLYSHLTIAGAKAENHQALIGETITLGYYDLVEAGFVGGGFSHIHMHQIFGGNGSPEFRYAGSVTALNYGESSENKGFLVFNTDTMSYTKYDIPGRRRLTFDATWNGELIFSELVSGPECAGARVRVRLSVEEGYAAEDGRKAIRDIMAAFGPLEIKIEVQTKPKDQVRAAEISNAHGAAEKLIAYWHATTEPGEPTRSDMLALVAELEAAVLTETGESK